MPLPLLAFSGEVMAGQQAGTDGGPVGTNGGNSGTDGRAPVAAALVVAVLLLAKGLVDAESIIDASPELPRWQPFALELTSAGFFAALIWPLWQLSRWWREPRLPWPAAVAAHLALSLPLVLAHALWLAGSRAAVFAAMGSVYRFDWSWAQLVFEWRKDVLTLVALAGVGWLLDRLFTHAPPAALPDAAPFRLAVKDGSRTILLAPHEVSHASSAGNYVELATSHGRLLHRVTLAALETELAAHGFVRIHRAHLVRVSAVAAVERLGSGDFSVTLADGVRLPGGRRWRDSLAALAL